MSPTFQYCFWAFSWAFCLLTTLAGQLGCQRSPSRTEKGASEGPQLAPSAFSLKAERFQSGGDFPTEVTCDGPDASPGLIWTEPPAATQSFALIMEERDSGAHASVRWIVYDIPGSARQLPEVRPKRAEPIDGTRQGINDSRGLGYSGACPPPGRTGRYVFKLCALDTRLELKAPVTTEVLEQRMKGHVLVQTELKGSYSREQQAHSPK